MSLSALAAFMLAYSSVASAYFLIGADKSRSLTWAVLPAGLAAIAYLLRHTPFCIVALASCMLACFPIALKLSSRNVCISSIALLLAASFMLSFGLISRAYLSNDVQLLIFALASLLLPTLLWLSKITIFKENTILTRDQRRTVLRRILCFFPGPVLLLFWQSYVLFSSHDDMKHLVIFTLLFQLLVLFQLHVQVQGMQERIENIIDKQYQSELLSFMQVIRSQRHDFNFHIQTICNMIENNDYAQCKDYVRSMMNTVSTTNEILPLYHPATSALLNTFREMAFQKGLQMDIEIHDNLQFIATSVFETNTILGNLLQNAIDELEMHPENESRVIRLLIIKRGQCNIIKVSNRCHLSPEEMSRIFLPGFTTKKSHEGLGLANALRVAEKYDGTLYPEFEDRTVHFIARIPLRDFR